MENPIYPDSGTPDRSTDSDFTPYDAQSWAQAKVRERDANPAAESWSTLCLPPGPMISFSGPLKIIQTPHLVTVLYKVPNNFRQISWTARATSQRSQPDMAGLFRRALGW